MSIGLRQLEAFRAVAVTGSFTRACQSLFITQSTVSQHVRGLETQLEVKLFDRNRRHVVLTPAGENLLQYCRHIFRLLDEAEGAVRSVQSPYSGRLSFGCASSTLLYQLPPLLIEYAKRFPKVELQIVGGTIAEILAHMEADTLDLALVILPLHLTHVRKVHLWDESFVLALPSRHRLACQPSIAIDQVRNDRFILQTRGQNTRKLVDRYLFRHHIAPRVPVEIADTETIKIMVAHGMGVSVLPASAFQRGREPEGLNIFPIPKTDLKRSLAVIFPSSKPLRAAGLALADLLQQHFQQLLPDGRGRKGSSGMRNKGSGKTEAGEADASEIQLREPSTAAEMEGYYDLRWRILREPWSRERGQERDQYESKAIHLAAWAGERIVGVGRVHFLAPGQAQIRYMAVEPARQGRGIGSRILAKLEKRARAAGAKRIVLNARDRAVQFYQRHGYAVVQKSEVLFDAIPHWEMHKTLG